MSDHSMDVLAGCHAYLEALGRHAARKNARPLPFITFSREAGAGAVSIGELTAHLLNVDHREEGELPWTVFDKNLVARVLEDHQLPDTLKRFFPEDLPSCVTSVVEEILGLHPSAWTLAEQTSETILRLAHLGNVILVGRGGAIITSKMMPAVHVRLVAPLETRVAHLAEFYRLTLREAAHFAQKADQGRRRYVKRYFRGVIDDPLNYTLTLNTGRMSYEAAAHVIAEALRRCANEWNRALSA